MQEKTFYIQFLSNTSILGEFISNKVYFNRSKVDNLPMIPANIIKGALREKLLESKLNCRKNMHINYSQVDVELFDKTSWLNDLTIKDSSLLLFPILLIDGKKAFVTCNYILHKYHHHCNDFTKTPSLSTRSKLGAVTNQSVLYSTNAQIIKLYNVKMEVYKDTNADEWADIIGRKLYPSLNIDHMMKRKQLSKSFIILPDRIFFALFNLSLFEQTNVSIDPSSRICKTRSLHCYEYLPANTAFWSSIISPKSLNNNSKSLENLTNQEELHLFMGRSQSSIRSTSRFIL